MSTSPGFSKCRRSALAEAITISSLPPSGMATPPTWASAVATRRQAMMEPATRRHSSTALGISAGLSQMASQALRWVSSVMKALAVALEVVSCAAARMAIIIERRYDSVTMSGCLRHSRMLSYIQPSPSGRAIMVSRISCAVCQKRPTLCAISICSAGVGRPQVLSVCATANRRSCSAPSSGTPRNLSAMVSGIS